jgi:tetratricopeptide (TPR) repeat protein
VVTKGAPQFSAGFYFYGQALDRANQIQDAKRNFAKSSELAPTWILPRLSLAQLYLATGDRDLALEESEKVLSLQPDNVTALSIAGAAYLGKNDSNRALALFRKARANNPQDPAPVLNIAAVYAIEKKYPEAIREYEAVLKLDPQRNEAVSAIAHILIRQNEKQAAVERVQRQIANSKDPAPLYQLLGQMSLENKEFSKAIDYLNKATELNPNLLSAYFLIGNAYAAQQKFDQAIELYEQVAKKSPKSIQPYMMVGILYDLKKQPQKSNEYYKKILDIDNNFYPAANNLAWNYAEHGGNLDIALGLAQKAREANPADAGVADTLGWIYYKRGIYGSALDLLKESNEKAKSSNPTILYHLGMAALKTGDKVLARESLSKSIALNQSFSGIDEAKKTLAALQPAK